MGLYVLYVESRQNNATILVKLSMVQGIGFQDRFFTNRACMNMFLCGNKNTTLLSAHFFAIVKDYR